MAFTPETGTHKANGHATPAEDNPPQPVAAVDSSPNAPSEPPDPFDPASLALGQDFAASVGVKKISPDVVLVRKPHSQEWVRVHPDQEYRVQTAVLFVKDSETEQEDPHLVAPTIWAKLRPGRLRRVEIVTAINREGHTFLWLLKLPGIDGRPNTWNASGIDAANYARERWVQVVSNQAIKGYEVFAPTGVLADPVWLTTPMRELLRMAFRDRFIDSLDHPVLKRIHGEV